MSGEKDISRLIKGMTPELQKGTYVFVSVSNLDAFPFDKIIGSFKEKEGVTLILEQKTADTLGFTYEYVASWITLKIHSDLEAVGLTAAFSNALATHQISCNVVAGFYHDHIFVHKDDGERAVQILNEFSGK